MVTANGSGVESTRVVELVPAPSLAKRPAPFAFKERPVYRTTPKEGDNWKGRSATVPHLWPEKARTSGMDTILRHLADYVIKIGWWPTKWELAVRMNAKLYAVDWFSAQNIAVGTMTTQGRYKKRRLLLTERGWASIGKNPVAPWQKPPSNSKRARMNRAVMRVVEQMQAAKKEAT